jgi:hypothetical protein
MESKTKMKPMSIAAEFAVSALMANIVNPVAIAKVVCALVESALPASLLG